MKPIILSMLLGILLVGCGSSDEQNVGPASTSPAAETPVVPDIPEQPPPPPTAAVETGAAWMEQIRALSLEEAFEAVVHDIGYAPYPGVLRGAQGTALASSGNALDQALLLAELVGEKVAAYRFAQGNLSDEPLATLLASTHRADAPQPAFSAEEYDLYDPMQNGALVDIARNHVWLEIKQADSLDWVPLDPSYPGAKWGEAFAETRRTFETPPGAMMQTLTIQFMQETEDGRTERLGQLQGAIAEMAQEPIALVVRGIPQREGQIAAEEPSSGAVGGLGGALGGGLRGGQQDDEPEESETDEPSEPGPLVGTEYRREVWHGETPESLKATLVRDDDPPSRIKREWIAFDLRIPGQPARILEGINRGEKPNN